MKGLSWSHALIQVHDFDAMVSFYTEVLGFEVTDAGKIGDANVAFMSQNATDHHQMALVSGKAADQAAPRANHFAFRVEALSDVKAWIAKLNAEDRIEHAQPVTHGNAWSVYFADPEGNGIEIFCDTPWHVAQPQGGGWDPDADDEAIHADTMAQFAEEPEFGAIGDYYAARAAHLGKDGA